MKTRIGTDTYFSSRGVRVYATAAETLGVRIPPSERAGLWRGIPNEQALTLISRLLAELDNSESLQQRKRIEERWVAAIENRRLKLQLSIAVTIGVTIFPPQLLLLAASETLIHSPDGSSLSSYSKWDEVVLCILGIGDETSSPAKTGSSWGGLDESFAGEIISNLHFNQSVWPAHQIAWAHQAWIAGWPEGDGLIARMEGQPSELFHQATNISIRDFINAALALYSFSLDGVVAFPLKAFSEIGIAEQTTSHILRAASRNSRELKEALIKQRSGNAARFDFALFRRFPLIRMMNGDVLVLRSDYLVQRALSEVAFFDVREYLKQMDTQNGTSRDEAFRHGISKLLERETGDTLRRIFPRSSVLDETKIQQINRERRRRKACDYAVRVGKTWLLIEVTDRAMAQPVVNASAPATALDVELDRVLIERKAKQLASTIDTLRSTTGNEDCEYIPLVLTASGGMPWNVTLHHRVQELLEGTTTLRQEYCLPVALLTLKDLRMLERAAEDGHDVVTLIRQWRSIDPGLPLDQFLADSAVQIGPSKWERDLAEALFLGVLAAVTAAKD